jgi:hypothetical protein
MASVVGEEWLRVPVGPDAADWVTARTERTVLAVVHTVAGVGHLLDAVELLECDSRVQVVFTEAPDVFSNGVAEFLRGLGAVVVPWHQAMHCEFDLALATDCAGVHQLRAPVLLLAHGVMNNKFAPAVLGGWEGRLVVGLAAPWLTWYGRLVPTAVGLSHVDLRQVVAQQCPQALRVATVIGDLCLDRLVVGRADYRPYREALGVACSQTLVAVSSTWGPESMFARAPGLTSNLVDELPAKRYRVVAGFHPALWFGHGPRQVLAWLREQRRKGLRLVDPLSWRGLVTAADVVIGDHGSGTVYAAAAGVPVLRMPTAAASVRTHSAVDQLARIAPTLRPGRPLAHQIGDAITAFRSGEWARVAARVTSEPSHAAGLLRARMYQVLRLIEPETPPETAAVETARLISE